MHSKTKRSIDKIRVSTGSAIVLGLLSGKLDAKPTTIYLLTYRDEKCYANCGFCSQARTSRGRADMLSRITWPVFPTRQVLSRMEIIAEKKSIKRVCLQTLNYPTVFDDILSFIEELNSKVKIPISVSCQPLNQEKMMKLAEAGVERISIALDAATREIFDTIKGRFVGGPYVWEKQREALRRAVKIFGIGSITTHLILGLGETEKEICQMIQWCVDLGVYPALFAFTPIPGTLLENVPKPSIGHYRRVQIVHYLITNKKTRFENVIFDDDDRLLDFNIPEGQLMAFMKKGMPFVTSGCPNCNRPYYNENPGGLLYNYPRRPLPEEIKEILKQIEIP